MVLPPMKFPHDGVPRDNVIVGELVLLQPNDDSSRRLTRS